MVPKITTDTLSSMKKYFNMCMLSCVLKLNQIGVFYCVRNFYVQYTGLYKMFGIDYRLWTESAESVLEKFQYTTYSM